MGCRLRVGEFRGASDRGMAGVSREGIGQAPTVLELLFEGAPSGDASFL